ncbi:hypothetical protein ACFSKJ_00015 [Tabrizicola soli]|uniref:hypothetical protein n=1 Tax=Tabrizicola soli TaxID=2185115 RepID=UPI00362BE1E3
MSFQKAADLLRLAELATARYQGVSLAEIEAEFGSTAAPRSRRCVAFRAII